MASVIDSSHHVEINGVVYSLAEAAEGDHYLLHGEPLRPPNAVLIQGLEPGNQKFQMRPDTLFWTITDWSGGEGQYKFDPQRPNRHWILNAVDPFTEPGKLMPGPYLVETTVNPSGTLNIAATLVAGANKFWAIDRNAANIYEWDPANDEWKAATAIVSGTDGATGTAAGDATYIYWKEESTDTIFQYDGTTFVVWNNDTSVTSIHGGVYSVGDYIYLHQASTGKVWEIPKTGTPPVASTLIDDPSLEGAQVHNTGSESLAAAADNRLYTMLPDTAGATVVREIVPTSAATTGYGFEVARIPGFIVEACWWHMGVLYMSGYEDVGGRARRSILYWQPGGDYGTLGRMRLGENLTRGAMGGPQAQRMLDHACVTPRATASDNKPTLFVFDAVGGGMAALAYADDYSGTDKELGSIASYDGEYFFSSRQDVASPRRIWRAKEDGFEDDAAYALSPWNDFGIAGVKLLSSVHISTEDLPADWTITLKVAKNGQTSFTTVGTFTTTGDHGKGWVVSTDSSTYQFRQLQVRIEFSYTGAGVPSTRPKINSVDVRAAIADIRRVWTLLLDLSDDQSGTGQSYAGKTKIANLVTAAALEKVIDFKDGYRDRQSGQYEQVDVVIDEYEMNLSHAGEGVGRIVLKEIV